MISLRKYQKDLLRRVETALKPERARVMMQLPTGGGKTIIAAHLLASYLSGARKAAWLTRGHRARGANPRHAGGRRRRRRLACPASIPSADAKRTARRHRSHGANRGTPCAKSRRVERVRPDDLLIIDEAHHAAADGYERAMKSWRGRVLGMGAGMNYNKR